MGCSVSRSSPKGNNEGSVAEHRHFKMTACNLEFNRRQLWGLNQKFRQMLDSPNHSGMKKEKQMGYLRVVVERLIQRLICNVGILDPRFSSKFLVNLEPSPSYHYEIGRKVRFKYLVRLDAVSSPAIYPEVFEPPVRVVEGTDSESLPEGYAKVRVHGEFLDMWTGFINSNGFLRRDKIQEKFVQLLARAAAKPGEPFGPGEVDESMHCGSPGKVVDPITLHHILTTSASHQFFFGSAECNESRFPDPRDFRIAIVEGVPETRLHVSFLSPAAQTFAAEDVEISIVLGIGVSGWPTASDFPFRMPLDHVDVVLGYQAAELGYYLVPRGPHASVYCEDRSSTWEIRTLGTEMFLLHHYSPLSVVFRVYKILTHLLAVLRARGVKSVNRYMLKNLFFFELEQKKKMEQWAPKMTSQRVLSILDRLLACLKAQHLPSYVFAGKNLLLHDEALEGDYVSDAEILEHYVKVLHNDSNHCEGDPACTSPVKDQMEDMILQKWVNVLVNMMPPASNRGRRLSVVHNSPAAISYTRQQIQYIALLIKKILTIKDIQRKKGFDETENDRLRGNSEDGAKNKEDFIYLLQIVFDQAKEKHVRRMEPSSYTRLSARKKISKLDRTLLSYDISTSMLVDDVKRIGETDFLSTDDTAVVVKMMEYLYKAIDSDGRVLGPILRPYLNQLFRGSFENGWFVCEWTKRSDLSELEAMKAFGSLVLSGEIEPLDGILNASTKGWNWATNCLQIIKSISEEASTQLIVGDKLDASESGLRLIFTPEPKKTIRFNVTTMKRRGSDFGGVEAGDKAKGDNRCDTIASFKGLLDGAMSSGIKASYSEKANEVKPLIKKQPRHFLLKSGNPYTVASMEIRRQGNHRGLGSIVLALISLQKLTVLQEVSQFLPKNERIKVLSDIKKLSKEVQRLAMENCKKKCEWEFKRERNRFSFRKTSKDCHGRVYTSTTDKPKLLPNKEVYRTVNEFATKENIIERDAKTREEKARQQSPGLDQVSLLSTCRKLRKQHRSKMFDVKLSLPTGVEGIHVPREPHRHPLVK